MDGVGFTVACISAPVESPAHAQVGALLGTSARTTTTVRVTWWK